jgi:hypothetical protein
MPGSGAEKYVTSAYVCAVKPRHLHGCRDDVYSNAVVAIQQPPPPPASHLCCPEVAEEEEQEEEAKPAC